MSHHWRKTRWWKADGEKKPKTEVDDASRLEKKNKQTKRTRQTPLVRPCKDSASQKWDAPSFSGLTQLERSAGFFSTGFYWLFTVVGCPFLGSIRVFFARYDRVLTVFLTVFLGVARFWLCPRVYYRALLGFTGFHCVLPGFTGFYWVLLGFTGFYWVLLGYTRFYWVFLVSLNLTRFKLGFSCFE